MLDKYILSIVKVEGLGDLGKSQCNLSLNNEFYFKKPLESLPATFNISVSGAISMTITDGETVIASLAFESSLLKYDWFYWLPLSLSSNNFITELPEKINLPRVLIGVNQEVSLPALTEISEFSDSCEDTGFESFSPHCEYQSIKNFKIEISPDTELIMSTENRKKEKEIFEETIRELRDEIFEAKEKYKILEELLKKADKEIEKEREQRLDLQKQLEESLKMFEKIKKREEKFALSLGKKNHNTINLSLESFDGIYVIPDIPLILEDHKENRLDSTRSLGNIERKVNDFLKRVRLVGLLKKSKDVNYIVGAKTVTLCMKQGEVRCKNGMTLDSYIFKNCKAEIEDLIRVRAGSGILEVKKRESHSPICTSRSPILKTQRIIRFH